MTLILYLLGLTRGVIFGAVTIQEKDNRIILNLISWEAGERIAQQEGGLPH